tara:strand:- start:1666 stop:2136 length:471 start_codon:yes stop_codon:yes gene_type:complete
MLNLTLSEESVYNIRAFRGEDHFVPCLWKDDAGSKVDIDDYTLESKVWGSGTPIALADSLTELDILTSIDNQTTNTGAFQIIISGVGFGCEFRSCNPTPAGLGLVCPQVGLTSGIYRVQATKTSDGTKEILLKGTVEIVPSVAGCFADGTTPFTSD